MTSTLYYIHDPMCSWCYAASSRLSALEQVLPDSVRLVKVVGGLAPDTMEPMPITLAHKIQQTWHHIEQTVPGVRFNFDFWRENTPIRSTYPACRAVLAAKKQGGGFENNMISAIQTVYYQKAENPSLIATLERCAQRIGLNISEFNDAMASDEIENELQNEIGLARHLGADSFPSLRLEHQGKLYPVAVDYLDHAPTLEVILTILAGKPTIRNRQP